jgi:hypothetical protein
MLPWAIAAGALAALLALAIYPRMDRTDDLGATASGPPITGTTAGARGIDLSSMTEREAADRLFNRVMQYVSDEDSVQARQFLPMALAAYQRVDDLDRDGHYHVAVLELVNENPSGARAHADTILAEEPDHLFGLATAAQAEMKMGNEREGQAFFRRFLEVYDTESRRAFQPCGRSPSRRSETRRLIYELPRQLEPLRQLTRQRSHAPDLGGIMATKVEIDLPFTGVEVVVMGTLTGDESVQARFPCRFYHLTRTARDDSHLPDLLRPAGNQPYPRSKDRIQARRKRLSADLEIAPHPERLTLVITEPAGDLDLHLPRQQRVVADLRVNVER